MFSAATAEALADFQEERGLPRSGELNDSTWAALVEAAFELGGRILYLRAPMLRGDDVAVLQRRLGALGFDSGRVDGIYGPTTAQAVAEFQRNAGLPVDEMCGPETVVTLERLALNSEGESVSVVRERDTVLHTARSVIGCRVVVGQRGGLSKVTRFLSRELRRDGAHVLSLDEEDWGRQASTANSFGADLFLGLDVGEQSGLAFYQTEGFESAGGRHLAGLLAISLNEVLELGPPTGMRLPILRETRMPAVLCSIAPGVNLEGQAVPFSRAVRQSVEHWLAASHLPVKVVPTSNHPST